MKTQNFARTLVTSALPYANGYIHLGHVAGAYLPADIYTRFLRLCGEEVIHVSGSDEHGVAITIAAETESVAPQEIVDKYHFANLEAFRGLGIDFDIFGRTSWPEHHETAREFFLALYEQGYLVEKETGQFYDVEAAMFLPDRYVEGTCPVCGHDGARGDQCDNCSSTYDQIELKNPVSKVSGKPPEVRTTKHLYFKLGDFQGRLEEYVETHAPRSVAET
ncbi:MAG: class I tRNA ligase family protein, partial [Candidatus Kapaibacterium sp.]